MAGVAWRWKSLATSLQHSGLGEANHAQAGNIVSKGLISIPALNREMNRKKDNEVIAAIATGPTGCGASRSNAGYDVRPVRGDPRGRNCCAGLEAENTRFPEWAEGEKRFRSAIRNP